jgi:hypothetical protein
LRCRRLRRRWNGWNGWNCPRPRLRLLYSRTRRLLNPLRNEFIYLVPLLFCENAAQVHQSIDARPHYCGLGLNDFRNFLVDCRPVRTVCPHHTFQLQPLDLQRGLLLDRGSADVEADIFDLLALVIGEYKRFLGRRQLQQAKELLRLRFASLYGSPQRLGWRCILPSGRWSARRDFLC